MGSQLKIGCRLWWASHRQRPGLPPKCHLCKHHPRLPPPYSDSFGSKSSVVPHSQSLPPASASPYRESPSGQARCTSSWCVWQGELQWNSHCQSSGLLPRCCLSKCQNGHVNPLKLCPGTESPLGPMFTSLLTPPPLVMATLGPVRLCDKK